MKLPNTPRTKAGTKKSVAGQPSAHKVEIAETPQDKIARMVKGGKEKLKRGKQQ